MTEIVHTGKITPEYAAELHASKIWERVWEWEQGDGFSVVDTHKPVLARTLIAAYLLHLLEDYDEANESLPDPAECESAQRRWVDRAVLESGDEALWKTHKRWWFGRRKILLVSC